MKHLIQCVRCRKFFSAPYNLSPEAKQHWLCSQCKSPKGK